MRICFFGSYNPNYSRNRVLMKAFRQDGHSVIGCHTEKKGIQKYIDLGKKLLKLHGSYDVIFVAFPGHQVFFVAWLLGNRKIIFDPFVSLYNTAVEDRREHSAFSVAAVYYYLLDVVACLLADVCIFDTYVHRDFFVKKFGCPIKKTYRVLVGSDPEVFFPEERGSVENFTVCFYGTHIPLQGVPVILEAFALLSTEKRIAATVIGSSIKRAYESRYSSIRFVESVPYESLRTYLTVSDVAIGILGTTSKASMVVPNKVYEAWACGISVITGRTEGMQEIAQDEQHVLYCTPGDVSDLVRCIIRLKEDEILRRKIGAGGHELFLSVGTPACIGEQLKPVLASVIP